MGINAVIYLDVPEWQIGQNVTVFFPDTMQKTGVCELLKEQEAVEPKKSDNPEESEYCCGICGYPLWMDELYCAHCGRRIEWEGR